MLALKLYALLEVSHFCPHKSPRAGFTHETPMYIMCHQFLFAIGQLVLYYPMCIYSHLKHSHQEECSLEIQQNVSLVS